MHCIIYVHATHIKLLANIIMRNMIRLASHAGAHVAVGVGANNNYGHLVIHAHTHGTIITLVTSLCYYGACLVPVYCTCVLPITLCMHAAYVTSTKAVYGLNSAHSRLKALHDY